MSVKMFLDQEEIEYATPGQTRFQAFVSGRHREGVGNSAEAGGKNYRDVWRYSGACAHAPSRKEQSGRAKNVLAVGKGFPIAVVQHVPFDSDVRAVAFGPGTQSG
jgi:hypothetical protein